MVYLFRLRTCLAVASTFFLVLPAVADSSQFTTIPAPTGALIAPDSPVIPGVRYGRVIRLRHSGRQNGTLLATFESWPLEFGVYSSKDDGKSWKRLSTVHETQYPGFTLWAEPDLMELPQKEGDLPAGTVLIAGNSEQAKRNQLEIYYSLDHGASWHYRGLVDNNGRTDLGLWEPNLNITSDGRLICYYSDERFVPEYSQLLGERVSNDGGLTWDKEQFVCAISDGVQRPGMAVTAKLPNGKYVMSFEAVNSGPGLPVHIKFSDDGIHWGSGPGDYGIAVKTSNGAYLGGCPYIAWSPAGDREGTLVLSARVLTNSTNADREIFINRNLGQGPWTARPSPVQWQGGNNHSGWSMGMIATADGRGILELAPSAVDVTRDAMLVGRCDLP